MNESIDHVHSMKQTLARLFQPDDPQVRMLEKTVLKPN